MRAAVVCLLAAARIISGVCDPGTNADTRAPSYVRCPVCPRDTWVTITNEWTILDFQAVVVDSCGRTHFHDKGGITRRIIVSLAATSGRARSTRRIPVGVDTTQMTIRTGQTLRCAPSHSDRGFL